MRERLRVNVLKPPLLVAVRLIPDLVVANLAPVAFGHGGSEVAEVCEVVGRGVGAQLVAARPAPGRRVAQPGDNGDVTRRSQLDDVIVLGPGIDAGRVVAPVDEVVLGVDLDVLPGKLLANEAEAGRLHQVENLGAFGRLSLLLQKRVDTKGADRGIGQRRGADGRRLQPRRRPNGRIEPVDDARRLPARRLFARQIVERPGVGPQGGKQGKGGDGDKGAPGPPPGWVDGIHSRPL